MHSRIIGVGAYLPGEIMPNEAFHQHVFLHPTGTPIPKEAPAIVSKFEAITEIAERRYAQRHMLSSDMAAEAAKLALKDAGLDAEELGCIILAHNFGDIPAGSHITDQLPNLAARVKGKLGIKNPYCPAFDILFGCPGWLQGMIQADYCLRAGDAQYALVIGAETLSRIIDPQDMDSMLFADGAGAVVLQATEGGGGLLSQATVSHCLEERSFLKMGKPYGMKESNGKLLMKMNGKQVFRYAYEHVPSLILHCLEKAGKEIDEVDYFLIHQANGKMLKRIAERTFAMAGKDHCPAEVFPMNIQRMGNNSVATIPTLLAEMSQDPDLSPPVLGEGTLLVMASVGAGMHANCVVYAHGEKA